MMKNRKATLVIADIVYRDKQESIDFIDFLELHKIPLHGIELANVHLDDVKTSRNHIVWFSSQSDVYDVARNFVKQKMSGLWNYADFKLV
jgi:hypothetical protein